MPTTTQSRPSFTKRREKMTPKMQAFKAAHDLSYVQLAKVLKLNYSKCYAWTTGVNGPQSQKEFARVTKLMNKINQEYIESVTKPTVKPAPAIEIGPTVMVEVEREDRASLTGIAYHVTTAGLVATALAIAATLVLF